MPSSDETSPIAQQPFPAPGPSPYSEIEFSRPPLNYPDAPFHEMFLRTAARVPDRPAIYWRDVTLSYRELHALVRSAAAGLHAVGLRKGDRLCLFMPNRPDYVIAWLAASMLGVVVSPMNPAYKEREVAYQLESTGAKAILTTPALLPLVKASRGSSPDLRVVLVTGVEAPSEDPDVVAFGGLMRAMSPARAVMEAVDPSDLLALPFSSGTTGLPKGVMLTHRNLVVNYTQFITCGRISEHDVYLVFLPLYHIYGVALLGQAMFSGAALVLMERFAPQEALDLILKRQVTILPVVPPVLLAFLGMENLSHELFPHVRYMLSAAAPLAVAPAERVRAATGIPILQAYGMTEASPLTHHSPIEPHLIKLGSAGVTTHDTEHRVVDLDSDTVLSQPGAVGEICVRGPQVMRGYWQAEGETARVLRDGWYRTGDVGFVDEHGYLFIVDRAKEMIKYKGFGIAPAELEAALLEHPAVQEAAVIGWPDAEAGEIPRAFVALRQGAQVSVGDLMTFVNDKVANYKAIRQLEFIDSIPKTASGKILRREIKERARQG